MSGIGSLLGGVASIMWVLLAFVVVLILRPAILKRIPYLSKLAMGSSGLSMEFAGTKLDEAMASSPQTSAAPQFGEVARRGILDRIERNADLLHGARLLWVDDHPGNNTSIAELLQSFGTRVDTPKDNVSALALLDGASYDVIVTDVARDNEGQGSNLKGLHLAENVFNNFGQQVVLFTARFDPATFPGATVDERLHMCEVVSRTVFGRTNRYDEVLHLILDTLERRLL